MRPKKCVAVLPIVVRHHPDCPAARRSQAAANGPAQVASDAYRQGWDGMFGAKRVRGEA